MFGHARAAMHKRLETRHSRSESRNSRLEIRLRLGEFRRWIKRWIAGLMVTLAALTSPHPGFAQGCSMCYTTAAAARAAGIQALRNGIIILMIPPTLITLAIFVIASRSRERF